MKTSLKMNGLLISALLALGACGPTDGNNASEDGPIDITDYDYTSDQVLEDIVEEEGAVDYYATAEMAVDAKLTIKPGVVIEFEEESGFNISNGTLVVEGTEDAGVIFRERTAGSGWLGVSIVADATQSISNLTIEDAGVDKFLNNVAAAGLSFGRDTNPTRGSITNLTITDSKGVGFFAGGGTTFDASGITVQGSAEHAFELESFAQLGMLAADTTATGNGQDIALVTDINVQDESITIELPEVPAHIESSIVLAEDNTLTINAGSELYFATDEYLGIAGTIVIAGTAEAPVTLGAIDGMSGGWAGLWIYTREDNTISNAVIENGGGATLDFINAPANIVLGDGITQKGKVTISDTTISGSAGWGIYGQTIEADTEVVTENVTYEGNALGDITLEPAE